MAASAKRNARIEISASAKGVAPGVADARRQLRMMDRERAKAAKDAERANARLQKKAAGMASSVGGGVKSGFGALLGLDAAGGIMGLVSNFRDVEKEMTRFQIDAGLSAEQMAEFRNEAMRVSNATGVSREEIVKGAHAYQILTGDADGARQAVALFAKVAIASGADMGDIASVAAAMRMNAKIDPKDFQEGFDVLLSMGHKGSVELRDFGGEVAKLMPMIHNFGQKDGMTQWTEMAAGLQGVRREFGSVEEAATGFAQLMSQLSKDKVTDRLAAVGIKVWTIDPATKKHVKRDFMDIMKDIHAKGLDQKQIGEILGGRQEAVRALNAIQGDWEEIIRLQAEAKGSNQVDKDAATYLESPTGKIERAMERVKNAIANALTPERVEAFANAIEGLVDHLGPLIEALTKVGELVGGLYSVGRTVRGWMPGGDGHKGYDKADVNLSQAGDDKASGWEREYGWSHEEFLNRRAAAKRNIADVDARNSAIDSIMGAEHDDKSTPESINRALAAKYADGGRLTDRSQAGASYLSGVGYKDPVEREQKRLDEMSTTASMTALAAILKAAIEDAKIVVNLDGKQVGKGVADHPVGRTSLGKR